MTRICVKTGLVLKYFLQGQSSSFFPAQCPPILSYLHTPSLKKAELPSAALLLSDPKFEENNMGWIFVLFFFFLILFCSEVGFRWLPKLEKLMFCVVV